MAKKKQPKVIVTGVLAAAKRFFMASAAYVPHCYLGETRTVYDPGRGDRTVKTVFKYVDGEAVVVDIATGQAV